MEPVTVSYIKFSHSFAPATILLGAVAPCDHFWFAQEV